MDCSIVIADQYYENNCYHVTMALGEQIKEYGDFSSCSIFMWLKVSTTEITHVRLIWSNSFYRVL